MALFLYRLGQATYRHRRLVLGLWFLIVLLRERAWWLPAWLDRALPNMDVEGANLEHRVASREAALAEDGDAPMLAVAPAPRGQE